MKIIACGRTVVWIVACVFLSGCATTHFSVWEKLGFQKRDTLIDRVERARDSQEKALKDFETIESLIDPLAVEQVELDSAAQSVSKLRVAYRNAARTASTVRTDIDQVDEISRVLFDEWEAELVNTASSAQRRADHKELADTRQAYNTLIGAMRSAEAGIAPVLNTFQDGMRLIDDQATVLSDIQVAGLMSLKGDVSRLSLELRRSVSVAEDFASRLR